MASTNRLTGLELVDCAKSCAKQGIQVAAHQCGYGDNTDAFMAALTEACQSMGIHIGSLDDLVTEQQRIQQTGGIEIAPDTQGEL